MNKQLTVNTFEQGLITDLDPLKQPKDSLSSALNATILTFNSNENSLLCDMGNGRVESAYLPEGYIPLGTTSFGGIIYIVSYNPENNRCLIGSFPSPERNFTQDEIGDSISIKESDFLGEYDWEFGNIGNTITNTIIKKKLSDILLNPGDKYIAYGDHMEECFKVDINGNPCNYMEIRFATINASGQLIYLDNLQVYKDTSEPSEYYPIKLLKTLSEESSNIDSYRELIDADYNIFNAKTSGNLYIVFKLDVPEKFNVTYSIHKPKNDKIPITFHFKVEPSEYNYLKHISVNRDDKVSTGGIGIQYKDWETEIDDGQITRFGFFPMLSFGSYSKVAKVIEIDTSLINSGAIKSNMWRYYKNSNGVLLTFNYDIFPFVGEVIEGIKLIFIPADKCVQESNLELLYNTESYYLYICVGESGSFSADIPFNDLFEENKLYFVRIICKIKEEFTYEYREAHHWLYTNEMFNLYYLTLEEDNFDNLSLPIEYKLEFSKIKSDYTDLSNSSNNDDTIQQADFVYSSEGSASKEYKTQVDFTFTSEVSIQILNNYNIFETDTVIKSLNPTEMSASLTYKPNIINNIKIEDTTLPTPTLDNDTITLTSENDLIKGTVTLTDLVYLTTSLKSVTVGKYYSPVLETLDDYVKYGLDWDSSTFYNSDTFVALGMSSGGDDSQGEGGVKNRKGLVTLQVIDETATNEDKSENTILKLELAKVLESDGTNSAGYIKLPIASLSTYIASNTNTQPIVPVLLTCIGGSAILLDPKVNSNYIGGTLNKILRYSEEEYKGKGTNRSNNFNSPLKSTYRYLWLFIKANNTTTYLPFDDFIKITPDNYLNCLYDYACVLALCYVDKSATLNNVKIYTVDTFDYNSDIMLTINIPIEFKNAETTPNILILNTKLSELYQFYKAPCVKTPQCPLSDTAIEYKTVLNNPYIDTLNKLSSDNPYLSHYINIPVKNMDFKGLVLLNNIGYAKLEHDDLCYDNFYGLTNMEFSENSLKYDIKDSTAIASPADINSILVYNNRLDEIGVNYNNYTAKDPLKLKFSDATGRHWDTITTVSTCNILKYNSFIYVSEFQT